ncbi:hypothetical protein [Xanthomonas oryzae]|uniref:hypothetical protein n=1 Tax=Xanthomonas oryzae TaxID=347 RepID=UPI000A817649|nr:hypothetical protein [Xanthomonas oryzae]QBI12021.1 hypothetical protein EYR02_08080 [Xanthomonas oryzae pv. oryzae]QBI15576.1 hypothetical protein EYR03_07825 [Xanthomonas oryzae pv. oryzae]TAO91289.1 hypothetical protein EYR05_07825 [Xanthomonas oryzae pv. oryzae]TAP11320.1 hypothetical protein EYR04_07800 [Xanthomonas oryzae pv. oryzae]UWI58033.1 hypothetical protein NO430_07490 [Xanthomonas oryzae pv. oryzae]
MLALSDNAGQRESGDLTTTLFRFARCISTHPASWLMDRYEMTLADVRSALASTDTVIALQVRRVSTHMAHFQLIH